MRFNYFRFWSFMFNVVFLSCFAHAILSKTILKEFYINQGQFKAINNLATFPFLALNESRSFSQTNVLIEATVDDSLVLNITNTHNQPHQFAIQGLSSGIIDIPSSATKQIKIKLRNVGCFIYHDPLDSPTNRYLGLGGLLVVKQKNDKSKSFYWNVKEHAPEFNKTLFSQNAVNWNTYYPTYFTCNSLSHPESELDTLSTIKGSLGDTITIYMGNTGIAEHAIHFHGFHVELLSTNKIKRLENTLKDSFPLQSMQTMVMKLVLDKKGAYPVHDHNLLAMTGGSVHPYGMMVMIYVDYP